MIDQINKKKLIADFQMMRDFEITARDQYLKIAQEYLVQKAGLQKDFQDIAAEEEKHSKIVETIIGLIEKL